MCNRRCDHDSPCIVSYVHRSHHMRDGCYILEWDDGTIESVSVKNIPTCERCRMPMTRNELIVLRSNGEHHFHFACITQTMSMKDIQEATK